jgi:hypothetical protein
MLIIMVFTISYGQNCDVVQNGMGNTKELPTSQVRLSGNRLIARSSADLPIFGTCVGDQR